MVRMYKNTDEIPNENLTHCRNAAPVGRLLYGHRTAKKETGKVKGWPKYRSERKYMEHGKHKVEEFIRERQDSIDIRKA